MFRLTVVVVVLFAALSWSATASAEQRPVALLQPDPELQRAVSLALSPWGIEVLRSDAPLPRSSQPEAVQLASQLAEQLQVGAVVWVTRLRGEGALLWVYDVRRGDITTRMVSETPPFDGPAAASVALSVKTVLRNSVVHEQRPEPPAPVRKLQPLRVFALEAGADARWFGEQWLDYEGRLTGIFWLPPDRRFGFSLDASAGLGLGIDEAPYAGRYRQLALGAKAHVKWVPTPKLSLVMALGGAAHWAMLRGELSSGQTRDVDRVNASVDLQSALNVSLSDSLYLGASLGASYFPWYRRYLVDGAPVFSPHALTPTLAAYVGAEL